MTTLTTPLTYTATDQQDGETWLSDGIGWNGISILDRVKKLCTAIHFNFSGAKFLIYFNSNL